MPELDPLPRRPRVPDFAPRTGDYAAMVGRARGRRRRHLSTAGAGAAGLAAVFVLTTGGGGGTFGLDPVQPATGIVAPEETPSPGLSPTPEPTATPSEPEEGEPGSTTPDPDVPSPEAPDPSDDPGTVIDYEGDVDHPEPPRTEPPVFRRDEVAYDATASCDGSGSLAAYGWCLGYDGPTVIQSDDTQPFRMLACRLVGRGTGTLTYRTEQEVDFTVIGGSREEWHWSSGYPFPAVTTYVEVPESRCARWTVEWDTRGDDGALLRPGSYSMSPNLPVSDWGGGTSMAVSSGYGLTITE